MTSWMEHEETGTAIITCGCEALDTWILWKWQECLYLLIITYFITGFYIFLHHRIYPEPWLFEQETESSAHFILEFKLLLECLTWESQRRTMAVGWYFKCRVYKSKLERCRLLRDLGFQGPAECYNWLWSSRESHWMFHKPTVRWRWVDGDWRGKVRRFTGTCNSEVLILTEVSIRICVFHGIFKTNKYIIPTGIE